MIEFDNTLHPAWVVLGLALIAGVLFWSYNATKKATSSGLALSITIVRALAFTMLILFFLNPVKVESLKSGDPQKVAVLVDTSGSMAFEKDGVSRLAAAKLWVTDKLKVPDGLEVELMGFGASPKRQSLEEMEATDPESRIADSLEALQTGREIPLPGGIIVLSDGADRSELNLRETAMWFREREIPVHTVIVGESDTSADIVLEHIDAPQVVPDNTFVSVTARIRASGYEGRTIPLQVLEGERLIAEKRIRVTEASMSVPLEFYPGGNGFSRLRMNIPPQTGERTPENNQREFGLTVLDQSLSVLYMEGSGMQGGVCQPLYLKHALESAPDIDVKVLHCDQYGSPPHMHSQIAFVDPKDGSKIFRVQNPTLGYPRTLEELLNYDVVICSDIPKEAFTGEQLKFTEEFVTKFGGGFVMIGGNTSFGSGGYDRTVIDRIVPVEMSTSRDSHTTTFQAAVPDKAWSHPIMQLGSNEKENREIWTEKFPALRGFNQVDRLKPGAVDLLRYSEFGNALILAAQEVGKGRTMAFTTDTTYLWGQDFQTIWGEKIDDSKPLSISNCDSRYYTKFWINAVRWLSANKFLAENKVLEFKLARTYYPPDVGIKGILKINDEGGSVSPRKISVKMFKGDPTSASDITDIPATRNGPGEYLVEFRLNEPGPFHIQAAVELKDGNTIHANRLVIGESGFWEKMDSRCNPVLLEDLANWAGGQFSLAREDTSQLMNQLAIKDVKTEKFVRTAVWDRWWWLVAVLALLSSEWFIRKRAGLV